MMNILDVALRFFAKHGYRFQPRSISGGEPFGTPIVYEYYLTRRADDAVVGRYQEPIDRALRDAVRFVRNQLQMESSHDQSGSAGTANH